MHEEPAEKGPAGPRGLLFQFLAVGSALHWGWRQPALLESRSYFWFSIQTGSAKTSGTDRI